METLEKAICESVRNFCVHPAFLAWNQGIQWEAGDLLLLNNSFVFRDVKTRKSNKYLAIEVDNDLKFSKPTIVLNANINKDVKRIAAKNQDGYIRESLSESMSSELSTAGNLMYLLIGKVDDSVVISAEISGGLFDKLIWNPGQSDLLKVNGSEILIRETYDESAIWSNLQPYLSENENNENFRSQLWSALDKLQDQAIADLHLPDGQAIDAENVTHSICEILRHERDAYKVALEKTDDSSAFNEVLRIAYNFASDATNFIRLIVSVCDLKPIVLWGTISSHYDLAHCFLELPWSRRHSKPSLKNYESAIKDARNSAFHNLFPFRKTLRVSLPQGSLGKTELRIFSEHSKKKENDLSFDDKPCSGLIVPDTLIRDNPRQRLRCQHESEKVV